MKRSLGHSGELSYWTQDEDDWNDTQDFLGLDGQEGDGIVLLEEAHEALNRLSQKTNKRGSLMRQPRRAEQWH